MNPGRFLRVAYLPAACILIALLWAPLAQAAPTNDDFSAAQVVGPSLPVSVSSTNEGATKQADEPNHAGVAGGHSVWFSWTPSSTGPVRIEASACFNSMQPIVAVYTGSSLGALAPLVSSDDFEQNICAETGVQLNAVAGTSYMIAVDSKNAVEGSFTLKVDPPPANDDFADATPLAGGIPEAVLGTTKLATKEPQEPDHAGQPGGHSVWYSWTPSSSGPIAMWTERCVAEAGFNTVLAVYTGSALGALTEVASNDDSVPRCDWGSSELRFQATANTTYWIAVDGDEGASGPFRLKFAGAPANDDFANPLPFTPPIPIQGSNVFATKQAGEPDHGGDPGGHSVWYSWTPTNSGRVELRSCSGLGEGLKTAISIYTGSSVGSLTPVPVHGSERCGPGSGVQFNVSGGTNYRIAVDGQGGAEGWFTIDLLNAPANDDFAAAETVGPGLPVNVLSYPGSLGLATKQAGEPDHAGDPGGHSVWYSWTPNASGPVDVSVCTRDELDTLLAVYTGNAVNALTQVASNDNSGDACNAVSSELQFDAMAGVTYQIAVDGKGEAEGYFLTLSIGDPAQIVHHTLTVAHTGSGTVSSDFGGIDCGATCVGQFVSGARVILTATPAPGWVFAGWSDEECPGTGACQVGLGSDSTIEARFDPVGGPAVPSETPSTNPPAQSSPKSKPKPAVKCRTGFKKVGVNGKARCVRIKHRSHRHKPAHN